MIYLVYDGLTNTVFDSQVLTVLEFLARRGISLHLVSFERRGAKDGLLQKKAEAAKRLGIDVLIIERPPFLGRSSLKALARHLAEILVERIGTTEPLILHCRGYAAAYIAIHTKALLSCTSIKVLADIRGVPEELLLLTNPLRWLPDQFRYREAKKVEREVYALSDGLCCVSNALKHYIVGGFTDSPHPISVVHCAVNSSLFRFDSDTRSSVRCELGLDNKLVFAYSGSLAPWQAPTKVLEFFIMAKTIHLNSHLLMLTKETSTAKRLLDKYGENTKEITLLSADYWEVPRYLMASDIGLLLRDNTHINRVAFPTKYSEYLSSGLYVLTTESVKDIAGYTNKYPITGYVLRNYPKLKSEELSKLFAPLLRGNLLADTCRYERSSIADRLFSAEKTFAKYIEVYDALWKS